MGLFVDGALHPSVDRRLHGLWHPALRAVLTSSALRGTPSASSTRSTSGILDRRSCRRRSLWRRHGNRVRAVGLRRSRRCRGSTCSMASGSTTGPRPTYGRCSQPTAIDGAVVRVYPTILQPYPAPRRGANVDDEVQVGLYTPLHPKRISSREHSSTIAGPWSMRLKRTKEGALFTWFAHRGGDGAGDEVAPGLSSSSSTTCVTACPAGRTKPSGECAPCSIATADSSVPVRRFQRRRPIDEVGFARALGTPCGATSRRSASTLSRL